MLHFNELRYSDDNKNIIIDASVDSQSYYDNIIINSIIIDNQNTFVTNGPSSNPIYTYNVEEEYPNIYSIPENCNCNPVLGDEDKSYCFIEELDSMKHIRLVIPASSIKVDVCKDMLFVYVIASGIPGQDTPCGFDNNMIMGTIINLQGIYNNMLYYIREIEKNCSIPKNFIDLILRFKALEVCVRTGNYPLAIKYWNKFYSEQLSSGVNITNCKCYG